MSVIRPHSKRETRRSSSVANPFGMPVGGDDYLFLRVVERVEGMEELLLGLLLLLQELDVVDQEHIDWSGICS